MVNHILGFMLVKTFFAILTKIVSMAPAFDWTSYKSNIWYYYYPFNNHNFSITYLIAGITLPIIMIKKIIKKIKKKRILLLMFFKNMISPIKYIKKSLLI